MCVAHLRPQIVSQWFDIVMRDWRLRGSLVLMERKIIHIVGGNSRSRAEQARTAFALGHHAEVYAGLEELLERPPQDGVIMAADERHAGGAVQLIAMLEAKEIWLPVVVTSESPQVEEVVAAISAGALDYLQLPLEVSRLAGRLEAIRSKAELQSRTRRIELEARRLIASLSKREGEVLQALSSGCSNKEIARMLEISPRTVEIHRANMMKKLDANHPADAVRLWLAAKGRESASLQQEMPDTQEHERNVVRAGFRSSNEDHPDRLLARHG